MPPTGAPPPAPAGASFTLNLGLAAGSYSMDGSTGGTCSMARMALKSGRSLGDAGASGSDVISVSE